jgi:hypothetical protein
MLRLTLHKSILDFTVVIQPNGLVRVSSKDTTAQFVNEAIKYRHLYVATNGSTIKPDGDTCIYLVPDPKGPVIVAAKGGHGVGVQFNIGAFLAKFKLKTDITVGAEQIHHEGKYILKLYTLIESSQPTHSADPTQKTDAVKSEEEKNIAEPETDTAIKTQAKKIAKEIMKKKIKNAQPKKTTQTRRTATHGKNISLGGKKLGRPKTPTQP